MGHETGVRALEGGKEGLNPPWRGSNEVGLMMYAGLSRVLDQREDENMFDEVVAFFTRYGGLLALASRKLCAGVCDNDGYVVTFEKSCAHTTVE